MQYIFLSGFPKNVDRTGGSLWFEIDEAFQPIMRDYLVSKLKEIEDVEHRKIVRSRLSKGYLKQCKGDYSADIFAYCKVGGKQHFRFYTNCGKWRVGSTRDQALSLMERVKFEIVADLIVYKERMAVSA